ncbi:hypothetical protein CDL12_23808 [Handroanthus impetiginosus]|uniref:BHLH domain-containing protein n=1 Tax=Handroanthus impetiginosus TaxID=429701 RepID=A0A2G9GEF4_9LAMI|nr:hypothetical protein CDL12_23808 [Handroanthus impetiginosus]
MDNNSGSIFPLQQEELCIPCPEFTIWDVGAGDHISYPGLPKVEGTYLQDNKKEIQQSEAAHPEMQKKVMHREIERKRRQEMATLCGCLRSILPPQYLKGKRSASEQIDEAAKYIRCIQNNIRELEIKRDNMKRLICKNESLDSEKGSCSRILPVVVKVQTCSVGVETLITGDFMAEGPTLPLSRILKLLLEEGLIVVSCNSTKDLSGRLHYVIQSEVLGYPDGNLQMLQRKLASMINNYLIGLK